MAEVTSSGVIATPLDAYVTQLEDIFRSVYGDQINLSPESQQAQVIGAIALLLVQADEAVVRVAQATDINKAAGTQLEGQTAILAIGREPASRTQVTVTLAGVPATLVPANARAKSTRGDIFFLAADTQLGVSGQGTATMYSASTGAITVLAGELTQVLDIVPGWETVTNATAGTPGTDRQTDTQLRKTYFQALARNAASTLDSIIGAVSDVEGVTDIYGVENDTAAAKVVEGVSVEAHTIAMVVEGGGDVEVAAAIRLKKPGGVPTQGNTSVDDRLPSAPIKFYRPEYLYFTATLNISIRSGFPGNGQALIQQRVQEYVNGTFAGAVDGYFETDGLTIAENLTKQRLYTPLNSVPGYDINSFALAIKGAGTSTEVITANLNQKVRLQALSDIIITVTT